MESDTTNIYNLLLNTPKSVRRSKHSEVPSFEEDIIVKRLRLAPVELHNHDDPNSETLKGFTSRPPQFNSPRTIAGGR